MTTDAAEALAEAVAAAVAALPPAREYTLEGLGHKGWIPIPGIVEGLAPAMHEAARLSGTRLAGYRVVSPRGRILAVYSSGDLVSVPLVIP